MQTAGVVFPVPILLLIPIREYILPRIFGRKNLSHLDPAPYEDDQGRPLRKHRTSKHPENGSQEASRKDNEPATGVLQDEKNRRVGRPNSLESGDRAVPGATMAQRADLVWEGLAFFGSHAIGSSQV